MTIALSRRVACVALIGCLAACRGLLDVSDPTLIQDSDLASTSGANAQRLDAVDALNSGIGSVLANVAVFTDERMYDAPSIEYENLNKALDTRDTASYNAQNGGFYDPMLGPLTHMLATGSIAIAGLRANADTAVRGDYLAQMYVLRGYAIIQIAEDLCSGFPLNEVRDGQAYYSAPFSTDAALQYAISALDTALLVGRDSARFLDFARVLKGRALVDLAQYDSARAVVASVSTNFVYTTDVGNAANTLTNTGFPFLPVAVGNREGGVGLSFASSHDPRIPEAFMQMRYSRTADTVSDSLYDQRKYVANVSSVVLASGVEARLIEAEAALHDNDPTTWLGILNGLRSAAISPALSPLSDPGPTTRLDTLFKERAFWMYLTGHRLGDMRRLVRRYGRSDTTVFAHGVHPLGIVYGDATSIPFNFKNASLYNPHITQGCRPEP